MGIRFDGNKLYEVKNISKFETPEGIDQFTVGCLDIHPKHLMYKQTVKIGKGKSLLAKQGIDTLQFIALNPKTTKLYALIYMQNGVKNLILDTDFDNSFINEKVYQFDFNKKEDTVPAFVYVDLRLPIDSFQYSTTKTIPVKILMNDIEPNDKIGDNDSLQVYISPNFFYQGYFLNDSDTVFINLQTQNFDLFYNKQLIEGTYYCKKWMNNPKHFDFYSETPIQIKNRKYQFEDCGVINKTLTLTRLEDDSIGTNRGNYLASTPELDSLYGHTLLFFTGSWCKPCKILLDSLLLFHKLHPETHIISVNSERDSTQFLTYLNKYQIPWKIILEMEPKIESLSEIMAALKESFNKDSTKEPSSYCDVYNVETFPTLFLINPQRKILFVAEDHVQGIKLLKKIEQEGYEVLESFNH
jgi:thiol-disulfide isomerase/thioredoxin